MQTLGPQPLTLTDTAQPGLWVPAGGSATVGPPVPAPSLHPLLEPCPAATRRCERPGLSPRFSEGGLGPKVPQFWGAQCRLPREDTQSRGHRLGFWGAHKEEDLRAYPFLWGTASEPQCVTGMWGSVRRGGRAQGSHGSRCRGSSVLGGGAWGARGPQDRQAWADILGCRDKTPGVRWFGVQEHAARPSSPAAAHVTRAGLLHQRRSKHGAQGRGVPSRGSRPAFPWPALRQSPSRPAPTHLAPSCPPMSGAGNGGGDPGSCFLGCGDTLFGVYAQGGSCRSRATAA